MKKFFPILLLCAGFSKSYSIQIVSASEKSTAPCLSVYKNLIKTILFSLNRFPDGFIKNEVSLVTLHEKKRFDREYLVQLRDKELVIEVKKGNRDVSSRKLEQALTKLFLTHLTSLCSYQLTAVEINQMSQQLINTKQLTMNVRKQIIYLFSCISPGSQKLHFRKRREVVPT